MKAFGRETMKGWGRAVLLAGLLVLLVVLAFGSYALRPLRPDIAVLASEVTLEGLSDGRPEMLKLDTEALRSVTAIAIKHEPGPERRTHVLRSERTEALESDQSEGAYEASLLGKVGVVQLSNPKEKGSLPATVTFALEDEDARLRRTRSQDGSKPETTAVLSVHPTRAGNVQIEILADQRTIDVTTTVDRGIRNTPVKKSEGDEHQLAPAGKLLVFAADENTELKLHMQLPGPSRPVSLLSLPVNVQKIRARCIFPDVSPTGVAQDAAVPFREITVAGSARLNTLLLTSRGLVATIHADWSSTVLRDGSYVESGGRVVADFLVRFFLAVVAILTLFKTCKELRIASSSPEPICPLCASHRGPAPTAPSPVGSLACREGSPASPVAQPSPAPAAPARTATTAPPGAAAPPTSSEASSPGHPESHA